MPRDIPIGNGSLLISFDRRGLIHDLFYPSIGMENHVQGHPFRAGVWANGSFSWLYDGTWDITLDYEDETLVALMSFINHRMGLEIKFRDVVDFHEDVHVRAITLKNLKSEPISARIFFNHDFHIYGTDIGDTACYKPDEKAILHYKGRRYFLINCMADGQAGVEEYATGIKESKGMKGTWVDAEDGVLSGNPVAQGSVDSTIGIKLEVPAGGVSKAYYWMAAGEDWKAVTRLNAMVTERSPEYFIKRTADYWRLWLSKEALNFGGLPEEVSTLYKRSLLVLRTNVGKNGAIIAASDSDILHFARDTYSYVWPRDGAIVAYALDLAGYPTPSRNFFDFCGEIIGRNGYFLHKYNTDGSLASSWHPWVMDSRESLPIQEDETGLVLWALWEHFKKHRDIEFIKPLYRKLIKSTANFMCNYIDQFTGLPLPSYDLWEERLGIHTFTVSCVIAGLRAASRFTEAFGEDSLSDKYISTADRMANSLVEHLYDKDSGRFVRSLVSGSGGTFTKDPRIDSSICGIFLFGVFPPSDENVSSTMKAIKDALWIDKGTEGMARYEDDAYQRDSAHKGKITGNPWIISTLWYARYLIEVAEDSESLKKCFDILRWVSERAFRSGVLPEQINPFNGEPISVSPLTWAHAELIISVQKYLDRLQAMSICPHCGHPSFIKHEETDILRLIL